MGRRRALGWRRGGDMVLRILAAVPLGYAVGSLWAMALARTLPMATSEATVSAQLVSFSICAGAAMWAFAAPSGWRALWTLLIAAGVPAAISWASLAGGGQP